GLGFAAHRSAFPKTLRRKTKVKIDNGTGGSRETSTGEPERVGERGREPINFFSELKRRNVDTNRRRQPLMRCIHKSDQLPLQTVRHGYNERHPHSSPGTRWRRARVERQASTPCQRPCLRSAHRPWIPRTPNA